jgi:hypothetical protein
MVMSDNTASHDQGPGRSETIAALLEGLQPIGDLDRFAIEDLTPEDADKFFRILEEA